MGKKPSLGKKLAARAIDSRGRLYQWTRENYAELVDARKTFRPTPTWQDVADLAAESGLRDENDKPPTAAAMRKAFGRVEADIESSGAPVEPPAQVVYRAQTLPPPRPPLHDKPRAAALIREEERLPSIERPNSPRPKLVLKPARVPGPGDAWKDDGSTLPKPTLPKTE